MIGLKRGTVKLMSHQKEWIENAEDTIRLLSQILGDIVVDMQHVGSTAIPSIHAKPIIDIVVGVQDFADILPYMERLRHHGFVFRREDIAGQMLFIIGDFENDSRTHHIHVVKWNGAEWKNYISFRDYLNAYPEKARLYDSCKQGLAERFPNDRKSYTAGKENLINSLLSEASVLYR